MSAYVFILYLKKRGGGNRYNCWLHFHNCMKKVIDCRIIFITSGLNISNFRMTHFTLDRVDFD